MKVIGVEKNFIAYPISDLSVSLDLISFCSHTSHIKLLYKIVGLSWNQQTGG